MKINIFILIFILIISNIKADFSFSNIFRGNETDLSTELKVAKDIKNRQNTHFKNLWNDVFEELQDLLKLENSYAKTPNSSYLGRDKKSVKTDIDKTLSNIYQILSKDDILSYKQHISDLNQLINTLQREKENCIEKRITAPQDSVFDKTKNNYDEKIRILTAEIKEHKRTISSIKNNLHKSFDSIGLVLTKEDINIMLSKVYGDDIIEMTVIIGLLNQITEQLKELMNESSENLQYAKKYYGLFMVTLQIVQYTQTQYIHKVDLNIIPKVKKILKNLKIKIRKTKLLYRTDKNKNRKNIYEQNIKTQKFTLKVSKLYLSDLILAKENIIKGRKITKENLKLAKNTYETVSMSSDLSSLIIDNKNMFTSIMKIQMPKFIPFKNKEIEKKYIELTNKLIKE